MIERKCASESETRRNRLSELATCTVPLTKSRSRIVAAKDDQVNSTRRHHSANVNWITFGKISAALIPKPPRFRLLRYHHTINPRPTFAGYKNRFEVNSRRAFDILLSYHLGSGPTDRAAERLVTKLSLPTRFRWFKDEFIHSNHLKAVYKEESLRNLFGGFLDLRTVAFE